jgi:ABC-type dipeptide/oligopeptide/nickel transport system permease subunit
VSELMNVPDPIGVDGLVESGDVADLEGGVAGTRPRSPRREAWRRFRRNWLAMIGLVVIVVLVLVAMFAPVIRTQVSHQDPYTGSIDSFLTPNGTHWFGTDNTGRDIFIRVVYGARISLRVGFISALIATVIGVIFGAYAAYYGKFVDGLLMRFTDIFLSLPYVILAVVLVLALGRSEFTIIAVLGFLGWMGIARVFRSSMLQVKERDFVEAARAMGCGSTRIIWRHLVPNAIQPVIAYAATFVGTAVLSEAALSFLGVGAQDPVPAWGLMVDQAKGALVTHPHQLLFPALAIFLMVSAFVFVGDGLRDALDPRATR